MSQAWLQWLQNVPVDSFLYEKSVPPVQKRYPINAPNLTPAQVRERAEIAADAEIIQTFIASLLILEIPSQLGHAPMAAR